MFKQLLVMLWVRVIGLTARFRSSQEKTLLTNADYTGADNVLTSTRKFRVIFSTLAGAFGAYMVYSRVGSGIINWFYTDQEVIQLTVISGALYFCGLYAMMTIFLEATVRAFAKDAREIQVRVDQIVN
jgi:hypothetical protein